LKGISTRTLSIRHKELEKNSIMERQNKGTMKYHPESNIDLPPKDKDMLNQLYTAMDEEME
jgi:DNA-binding HxlR family transcriptional regulator